MPRGPVIKQSEVNIAHQLKAQGKTNAAIAKEIKRSAPTVGKMLAMQPDKNEQPTESLPA